MKVRCATCRALFDQHLAAQTDCPRCEREPVASPPVVPDLTRRTCTTCGAEFRIERKRGRPPLRCAGCRA